jgi:hypothetical protein
MPQQHFQNKFLGLFVRHRPSLPLAGLDLLAAIIETSPLFLGPVSLL